MLLKKITDDPNKLEPKDLMSLVKYENSITPIMAFESDLRIGSMLRENEDELFDCLNGLIFSANASLGISNKTTPYQALQIIQMIMNDYKNFSIEMVSLAFKYGKTGAYGPNYGKVDLETVSFWLRCFCTSDEYLDWLETRHKKNIEISESIPNEKSIQYFKMIQETIKQVEDEMNAKKNKGPVIISSINEKMWIERIKIHLDKFQLSDLEELLIGYTKLNWIEGKRIIEDEIKRRR